MSLKLRLVSAASVGGMAFAFIVSSVVTAESQGLFDFLFKDYSYSSRRHKKYPPIIKVKGPRYYKYSPDRVTTFSFSDLAESLSKEKLEPDLQKLEPDLQKTRFALAREHFSSVKLRTLSSVAKALVSHYAENPKFIWIVDNELNAKAVAAIAVLEKAEKIGLSGKDYKLKEASPTYQFPDLRSLMQFEIELSAKVLTYRLDVIRGRINPNRISGYHDFVRKKVDLVESMRLISETDDIDHYLMGLHPGNANFKTLIAELSRLRSEDGETQIRISATTFLRPGTSSTELSNIVAAIRQRGTEKLKQQHSEILAQYKDGEDYAPKLVALVRDFQKENDLSADGIIGRNTVRALVPLQREEKIRRIELALERLRWLPKNLGARYVFINQPSFTATYVHDGQEPISMRAIIGKKSNQTSFFVDKIETVEYNPYWGVPFSIIVNEMLPRLSRDPSYLDRLGYEVTTPSGRRVSSSSVNWYSVATKRTAINVRQPPSLNNALGAVKILFPNKHAIYMHDTPNKELFDRSGRAFSHGCVRLKDPRAMAAAVLGKTTSHVDRRIAEGRNQREGLEATIPVYVSYFTAWPDSKGNVQYFDDVYDRDVYLSRAIERTEAARDGSG